MARTHRIHSEHDAKPGVNPVHLAATTMLDYHHPAIQRLVTDRDWADLPDSERIGAVYDFVRDEIPFGYNASDHIAASVILDEGYGQCNTKTTLLMALLRAVGIPCRIHGSTIHKRLQKGIVNGIFYRLAPDEIDHTWAEVAVDGNWIQLEGVILDNYYLNGLRHRFPAHTGEFLGYAAGTENLACPTVTWSGNDTSIQSTGVESDHGVYDSPDTFYAEIEPNLSGIKAWLFEHLVRHNMNRNVAAIRAAQPRDEP